MSGFKTSDQVRESVLGGEPKKVFNHESRKGQKHEKEINNNFVLSKFRVFVIGFYPPQR